MRRPNADTLVSGDFTVTTAMKEVVRRIHELGVTAPEDSFWQRRYRRNVLGQGRRVSKEDAWQGMLIAILTSQTKSVAASDPTMRPWENAALSWPRVSENPEARIGPVPGMRYPKKSPKLLVDAAEWLNDNWDEICDLQTRIAATPIDQAVKRYRLEREAAELLSDKPPVGIKGVGAKQARNFWQFLGFAVWTSVLDRRVARILNASPFELGIPVTRGRAVSISEKAYVEAEISLMEICRDAGSFPCMVDAALFDMEEFAHALVGIPRRADPTFREVDAVHA